MKILFFLGVFVVFFGNVSALTISEIMSNPVGTDNGREWIELYNDTGSPIDLSGLSLSASETGNAVALTPLQGGVTLPPQGYAIIATIVSGSTKFLEDYSYTGILLRVSSTFSLTNGNASLFVRRGTSVVASVPSYTAAAEGSTLSFIGGSYVTSSPTPGALNQASSPGGGGGSTATTTPNDQQVTLPQATPPSPDIVIYLPQEKLVVAGASSLFTVAAMTRAGKEIDSPRFSWAFGDGGHATGSSTSYRYTYAGRYVAQVEAMSPTVAGTGRMRVRVVPPEIAIDGYGNGKYGSYVDIANPNEYDLDISEWMLTVDGAAFHFPRNTLLAADSVTRFSGAAMGFASSTISTSTLLKIQFPNLEEVTRFTPQSAQAPAATSQVLGVSTTSAPLVMKVTPVTQFAPKPSVHKQVQASSSVATSSVATTSQSFTAKRDTRVLNWFKSLFGR